MVFNTTSTCAQPGDLAQLVTPRAKSFFARLTPERLETHRGILSHDDLIGKPWGSQVFSHLGRRFILLQPGLADLLRETRRSTQIMYPKDIGFILIMMGIYQQWDNVTAWVYLAMHGTYRLMWVPVRGRRAKQPVDPRG